MLNLVIPVYKAVEVLPDLLNSLVAQTRHNFITTIVNDCDGLDYSDIIEKYRKLGLHIRYFELPENKGPGVARQYGFDSEKMCDYVMFCDADDRIMPYAVEFLYTHTKGACADVGKSPILHERKNSVSDIIDNDNNNTWLHGKIYRSDYLRENNIRFREDLRVNEDVYFNTLALGLANKIESLNIVTYMWCDYKESITRKNRGGFAITGNWQFIHGSITATEILSSKRELKNEYYYNLISSYYIAYQTIKGVNGEYGVCREDLKWFFKLPIIQKILTNKSQLGLVSDKVKVFKRIDRTPYYFEQSFPDWILEFSGIDIRNLE